MHLVYISESSHFGLHRASTLQAAALGGALIKATDHTMLHATMNFCKF